MYYIDQKIRDYEQLIYNLINKTNASIVFLRICSYAAYKEDQSWPKQKTLSQDTRLSIITVKRMISYLKEKRFIEINKKNGMNYYTIPITREQIDQMDIEQIKNHLSNKINSSSTEIPVQERMQEFSEILLPLEKNKECIEENLKVVNGCEVECVYKDLTTYKQEQKENKSIERANKSQSSLSALKPASEMHIDFSTLAEKKAEKELKIKKEEAKKINIKEMVAGKALRCAIDLASDFSDPDVLFQYIQDKNLELNGHACFAWYLKVTNQKPMFKDSVSEVASFKRMLNNLTLNINILHYISWFAKNYVDLKRKWKWDDISPSVGLIASEKIFRSLYPIYEKTLQKTEVQNANHVLVTESEEDKKRNEEERIKKVAEELKKKKQEEFNKMFGL